MATTTLKVSGMSCEMCVKHVTNGLQNVEGVRRAQVSLNDERAVVEHDDVPMAKLIEAVEEEGYQAQAS